jgi:hypothetical protein
VSSNEQLEQPLWELIYELLSPDEEAALRQRITSDPELARAYARVRLQSELVAAAAKCDDTRGTLKRPGDEVEDGDDTSETGVVASDKPDLVSPRSRSHAFRAANWIVAAAAMGLVVMSAMSLSQLRSPAPTELARTDATSRSLASLSSIRTVVATPAVWNKDTMNPISVRTSSLDGTPAATSFDLKLYDAEGEIQLNESYDTDEAGTAQVELSGWRGANTAWMEVAVKDDVSPPLAASARWVRSGHLTHLTTDLPTYQPGDTVFYRSLSLSRFDQRVDGEVSVEFNVLDDQGRPIPSANHLKSSERGVADGKFSIPANAAYGRLTVQVSSPDSAFPTQQRDVLVRKIDIPRWNKELKLARDSYEPGDKVEARLSVTSQDGQPAVGTQLSIAAFVDQQPIKFDAPKAMTDVEGNYDIHFSLPQSIIRGDAVVTVNVADDQFQEQLARAIPIHTGRADVQFFPEGGELAAGLRNDVYFQARDLQGQPIHLEGRVVDDAGNDVARAVTVHDGRGKFAFTTQAGTAYQLIVDKPAGAKQELMLPTVSSDAALVLHASGQVFDPQDPLDITLRMRSPDRSLVLAAACRGGLVGLQAIERFDFLDVADGTSECQRQLKLAPGASGVIRVTVYDSSDVPPTPMAERLVFRRPARQLQVQVDPIDSLRLGEQVTLGLQTTDEQGQPAAATLGISVVKQALLNVAKDQFANLETHVFLTSEIRNADELEDANFFLGTSDEAATAMDLLLGTQGWRRFVESGLDQIVQADSGKPLLAENMSVPNAKYFDKNVSDQLFDQLVPVVLDNRDAIEYERAVPPPLAMSTAKPQWIRSRETLSQRWGTVLMVGGLLVLVAVLGLAITRSLGRPQVWIPSVVTAGIATVLGVFWMGSQMNPLDKVAYAPGSVASKPAATASTSDEAITMDAISDSSTAADAEPNQYERAFKQSEALQQPLAVSPRQAFRMKAEAPRSGALGQRPEGLRFSAEAAGGGGFGGGGAGESAAPANAAKRGEAVGKSASFDRVRAESKEPRQLQVPRPTSTFAKEPTAKAKADTEDLVVGPTAAPKPSEPQPAAAATISESVTPKDAPSAETPSLETFERQPVEKKLAELGRRSHRVYVNDFFLSARRSGAPSTLLWQPLVITDANGRATVSFQLPSANVTYLLRADAHGGGRIGSGKAMIDARQP